MLRDSSLEQSTYDDKTSTSGQDLNSYMRLALSKLLLDDLNNLLFFGVSIFQFFYHIKIQ